MAISRRTFLAGAVRPPRSRRARLAASLPSLALDRYSGPQAGAASSHPRRRRQHGVARRFSQRPLSFHPGEDRRRCRRVPQSRPAAEILNLACGHPGGSPDEPFTLPPPNWRQAVNVDGTKHWGTSLHPPAQEENAEAARRMGGLGFRSLFLDDDFRLAASPGMVGGCFCDEHWRSFCKLHGHSLSVKGELAEDIRRRSPSPLLREWVDFQCSELTACLSAPYRPRSRPCGSGSW